jgi:hypothetical protein
MNIRIGAGILPLLVVAACGQRNLSGSYFAHSDDAAALLQLTETRDQQLMGNLVLFRLLPDGRRERTDFSITSGTVDTRGHTIALTMKPNELFAQAGTVSGELSNGGIDLAMPGATLHLAPSGRQEFDAAAARLDEVGRLQQQARERAERLRKQAEDQAKRTADDASRVAELTKAVAAYNARIQTGTGGPEALRMQEERLVDTASKDLAIVQDLEAKRQDYAAGQGRYRIGQLSYQMGQIRYQVEQIERQGHEHLASLDAGLAKSPCNATPGLQGCDLLAREKARYVSTRATVQDRMAQLSSDLEKNAAAMEGLNRRAGNR